MQHRGRPAGFGVQPHQHRLTSGCAHTYRNKNAVSLGQIAPSECNPGEDATLPADKGGGDREMGAVLGQSAMSLCVSLASCVACFLPGGIRLVIPGNMMLN